MSHMPKNIACCYDTTNWECINTKADRDGVVFQRPLPPMVVRGCGALMRRKNFKWTKQMSVWLQSKTHNLTYKSVPFTQLVAEAEDKWGYIAPKQEHLENKIRGRDKAKKDGRPPPKWVREVTL